MSEKLKLFMKGMKQHVAAKKMEDGNSQIIGKKKMDFKVYKKYEFFMKEEGKEFIFSCCFLTLEWNLMARLENIVYAHLYHIPWEDDCLIFCFVKSKTGQSGRNKDQVWHVYATSNNPTTCPVLALACYIFSNQGITDRHNLSESDEVVLDKVGHEGNSAGRLFQGGGNTIDSWNVFTKSLRGTLKNLLPWVFVQAI